MTEKPSQPREGALLDAARRRMRPKLSVREVAERADMSDGRWRQIVNGYKSLGQGRYEAVRGPADTVAEFAMVVNASPEELEAAGRPDAADELRQLLDRHELEIDVSTLLPKLAALQAQVEELTRMAQQVERQQRRRGDN